MTIPFLSLTPAEDAADIRAAIDRVIARGWFILGPELEAFEAEFAAKLNEITRDRARAREMGLAGRQRCIDEFSWEKIAQETVEVYKAAIAHHEAAKG